MCCPCAYAQCWTNTTKTLLELERTQRAIIRSILRIKRIDHIKTESMYKRTKIEDVRVIIKRDVNGDRKDICLGEKMIDCPR